MGAENRNADQADRWLRGFEQALAALSEYAESHSLARESNEFDGELRQLLFGLGRQPTHRAVFAIRDGEVIVYAIRHVAQRDLEPDDLL